ncbi:hypothetical protein MP228_000881 [Amoeboaphelidium protococcarum]|nr:hypothetical protein MP228_000881 [Amoeboaphelidium protococcarum]
MNLQGCSSAFWGDSITAAQQLVESGQIDYLVADYLAEVTMGILAKKRKHTAGSKKLGGAGVGGYVNEFVTFVIKPLLPLIVERKIKVVTNAGGLNPVGLKEAIESCASDMNLNVVVAAVHGDDLMPRLAEIQSENLLQPFTQMDDDQAEQVPQNVKIESLNAYIGAKGIGKALDAGAQIVVTGRCVDSALVLGPLLHEFKWQMDQFDLLAAGSVAGHIIECGCQATGGNFTDWKLAAYSKNGGYSNMGYPIVEVSPDGSFVVTKPDNTGGIVSTLSVGEQLVYEIGDPSRYILPDVIVDFTQVKMKQVGENRVQITGCRGYAPTDSLKVSGIYMDGYKITAELFLAGLEAKEKALAVGYAIIEKVKGLLQKFGLDDFKGYSVEALGCEHTYGPNVSSASNSREVVLRLTVHHDQAQALKFFLVEIAPSATCMAPGIIGVSSGRPRPQGNMVHFSSLIRKDFVKPMVIVGQKDTSQVAFKNYASIQQTPLYQNVNQQLSMRSLTQTMKQIVYVPLIKLCVARSGDKGDSANIGVIIRNELLYDWLLAVLTEDFVHSRFKHLMAAHGRVKRYQLPGIKAVNFLVTNCLGGGGLSSLNIDRQGKSYAQQLLSAMVPIDHGMLMEFESQRCSQSKL